MNDRDGRLRGAGTVLQHNKLKLILVLGDFVAVFLGFAAALRLTSLPERHGEARALGISAFAAPMGVWAIRSQGLLLARVCAMRVVEITRTARAMLILAGIMLMFDRVVKVDLYIRYTALASALSFVFVCVSRSRFRTWLGHAREGGRYRRTVAIIGTDHEAVRLIDLVNTHRDIGMTVVGVIGDPAQASANGLGDQWLGEVDHTESIVESIGASGVVLSPSGLAAGPSTSSSATCMQQDATCISPPELLESMHAGFVRCRSPTSRYFTSRHHRWRRRRSSPSGVSMWCSPRSAWWSSVPYCWSSHFA